ncbi:MAG: response regulator [Treponema sp.]|jgi:signal transduction histidine kinase/CheY-like chemotaxis protein|nr:response regulator [Treponema sp.]
MRSLFEGRRINTVFAQMLIIVVAFTVMGISSFFFASSTERKHLIKDAQNALIFKENEIAADLLESETFLSVYSETIRTMLIDNEEEKNIISYMNTLTNVLIKDQDRLVNLSNTQGYFHAWGGKYISGRSWKAPDNFYPQEYPWFKAAIEAKGKIAISEPYKDPQTNDEVFSFSRCLIDDYGVILGIISADIDMRRIHRTAITIDLTESSYGILMNRRLEIMAHPEPFLIGEYLGNTASGAAELAAVLEMGENVSQQQIKNYMQEDSIVFIDKVKYDWYLGVFIPVSEYEKNVMNMAGFLFAIGSLLAAALCIMLYRISAAKMKSDMRTQQKSNFLATMSHEIRTPLNAILGMTEIQMQNTTHPPATVEAFMKINNSGNLLLNIINDILDLSKIEAGKLELVPVKYEVASLINDIVQLNHIRYESKPIEFRLDIDENIPSLLVGDELRIKQILNNLLSNAFKYTDKGQVTLTISAECVGRGGAVLVTLIFQVSDTGQGMTSEQIGKLFDEYTRFNLEANRTTEGAGLGMTITRNLVELMYGKINVKSAVSEGTTVNVRLPQKTIGAGISGVIGKDLAESLRQFQMGNAVSRKRTQIMHEHMPYGHVLIVDDVETNLYVAKGLMAPYGLKIDLATSGFEALDKIKNGAVYDIIFMDHMMPKMDGIETTRQLRAKGYARPIVALTANAIAGQAEMFMKNGFDGFISKPIDIRQLNVSLNKLIRDKQPVEVVEAAQREKAEFDKKIKPGAQQQIDDQLAEIFSRDAGKALAVIENTLKNNLQTSEDIHMYVINVHAMKSALANIGENELSARALKLEQAGREKVINVMLSDTQAFLDDLQKVIERIKPKDEDNKIEDTDETLGILNGKLIVIREACEAYDKKAAKNALNELREITWSHGIKELINQLSEHLLHSEFDDASALIDKYKS